MNEACIDYEARLEEVMSGVKVKPLVMTSKDSHSIASKVLQDMLIKLRRENKMIESYRSLLKFIFYALLFLGVVCVQMDVGLSSSENRVTYVSVRDQLMGFSNASTTNTGQAARKTMADFDTFQNFLQVWPILAHDVVFCKDRAV